MAGGVLLCAFTHTHRCCPAALVWLPSTLHCSLCAVLLPPQEGLNRSAMDPKERAKAEMRDWLTSTVDSLNTQVGHAVVMVAGGGSSEGSCL